MPSSSSYITTLPGFISAIIAWRRSLQKAMRSDSMSGVCSGMFSTSPAAPDAPQSTSPFAIIPEPLLCLP